ncbi:hypothetical protein JCM5296_004260 [Sporobolomyces johnsonii]
MPAVRTRRSSLSSRVTLYEPAASVASAPPIANSSSSTTPATPTRRLTRSSAASSPAGPLLGEDLDIVKEEQEEDKPAKAKKAKSPRKPKPHITALAVPHPPPKEWERTYDIIRKQRERILAPVDTMGCEQGGRDVDAKKDEEEKEVVSDKDRRLSILVSLMLSSQTKDPVTHAATQNLRTQLPGGLTIEALEGASVEEIDRCICKVGFHGTKAGNLKKLAVRLRELHGGEVPDDLPSLLAINGVGPKMAYLYLQSIGQNIGIGVDTHVHRITNRLRWHKKETSTPEQTRLNLESWLPKHLWPHVNKMLVGFGQEICRPVAPRCELCDVATAKLCPSRKVAPVPRAVVASSSPRGANSKMRKVKEEVKEEEEEGKPKIEVGIESERVAAEEEDVGVRGVKKEEDEAVERVKLEVGGGGGEGDGEEDPRRTGGAALP